MSKPLISNISAPDLEVHNPFRPRPEAAKRRVCLIHPPLLTSPDAYALDGIPPLGLAYVAAALNSAGHQVSVIDGVGEALQQYGRAPGFPGFLVRGLSSATVIESMDPRADVIGISNMFSNQWLFVRDLIRQIRQKFPQQLIVLGGEHVTACAEYIIESCPDVDICVLGEGEETMLDLVDAYTQQRDFQSVPGIVFRRGSRAVRTANRERIRAIDDIPAPAWNLVPIEKYIDAACTYGFNLGRSIPLLASRGCPFQCTFCSNVQMWGTRWSARKPELVVAEMEQYIERYKVTNFDFYDLTAIVKKEWIVEFSKLLINKGLNITWQLPSGTRSEALDAEVMPLLYNSGCRFIIYAPESGSVEELRRIKKKIVPSRMIDSIHMAHRAGIQTKANLIFGMVGATWKDVFHTYVFLVRMAVAGMVDIGAFPFSPYPGSEDFQTLVASGRLRLDDDYFKCLLDMAMGFYSKNTVSYNDRFSSRAIAGICSGAFFIFYSVSYLIRPWRLINIIRSRVKHETSSLLTFKLAYLQRKKAVAKLIATNQSDTVLVPQELQVRNKTN